MAIIKRRIMTRGRIAAIFADRHNGERSYSDDRRDAETDMFFHMLAASQTSEDKSLSIRNDTNLGGLVVEYDDGK